MVMIFSKVSVQVNSSLLSKKKTTYEFLFVCLLVILVLVDKDNKPQWKPNSLQNISEQELEQYFQKPPSNEDLTLA